MPLDSVDRHHLTWGCSQIRQPAYLGRSLLGGVGVGVAWGWVASICFSPLPGLLFLASSFLCSPLGAPTHKLTGRPSTCLSSPLEFYPLGSVLGLVEKAWRLPRGRGGGRLGTQAGAWCRNSGPCRDLCSARCLWGEGGGNADSGGCWD